ncbi:translation initiation factor 4E [Aphelenchoides avenae]|nr:translation initiation factor 4E [Aphelenchus avenae]
MTQPETSADPQPPNGTQPGGSNEAAGGGAAQSASKKDLSVKTAREADSKPHTSEGAVSLEGSKILGAAFGPHPLQHRWTLWYLKGDRNKDWEDCLKQVSSFDTVEGFWALYNHLQPASGLNWGSDYYLFREGIKPMWEDENNVKGGRWMVQVDKQKRAATLDQYWLDLLLAMIGCQFEDHCDFICGAAVNVRQKGDKICLWTQDSLKDDVNLKIGQIIKKKLNIPDAEPIRYEVHKDASVRTGSMVKPRIVIPMREAAPVAKA